MRSLQPEASLFRPRRTRSLRPIRASPFRRRPNQRMPPRSEISENRLLGRHLLGWPNLSRHSRNNVFATDDQSREDDARALTKPDGSSPASAATRRDPDLIGNPKP